MEVGAVKQAFNNEVILLKKKLNQAKIQIIHKLTRKAKTLTNKALSDKPGAQQLQEKLKKKAESAVKEVMVIKKIKARDIARFTITHKGELNDHLNKPQVDLDKACARLMLHKSLQDKYKFLRNRFGNISINDLFMSRQERRKLKKEAREKQKNKKKGKENFNSSKNSGDWDVENVKEDIEDSKEVDVHNVEDEEQSDSDESQLSNSDVEFNEHNEKSYSTNKHVLKPSYENESETDEDSDEIEKPVNRKDKTVKTDKLIVDIDRKSKKEVSATEADKGKVVKNNQKNEAGLKKDTHNSINISGLISNENTTDSEESDEFDEHVSKKEKFSKVDKPVIDIVRKSKCEIIEKKNNKNVTKDNEKNETKKHKDTNKNKNFNEKIKLRKFNKGLDENHTDTAKIVDPFFITATGENYMSVAEPRQPDEVKEIHMQGNRKYRRAVMFGHVPKPKPRSNGFNADNRTNIQNSFNRNETRSNNEKFNKGKDHNENGNFKRKFGAKQEDLKPEKLHPSWEAKKKQSGILPFQGKKIVFGDN